MMINITPETELFKGWTVIVWVQGQLQVAYRVVSKSAACFFAEPAPDLAWAKLQLAFSHIKAPL